GPRSVLEVGCGCGVALESLAAALPEARLAGVDRSKTAIEAARERDRGLVEAGRLELLCADVSDAAGASLAAAPFDVVFAVNVNAFWLDPRRELAATRALLAAEGRLLLLYEPPSATQGGRIARDLPVRLEEHGFALLEGLSRPLGEGEGVGVGAAPRRTRARAGDSAGWRRGTRDPPVRLEEHGFALLEGLSRPLGKVEGVGVVAAPRRARERSADSAR